MFYQPQKVTLSPQKVKKSNKKNYFFIFQILCEKSHIYTYIFEFWPLTPIYLKPSAMLTLTYPYLHFGRLSFWSSSTLVVFHFGCLPFWSSSILVIFHFGRLPFWSSSILVVFHFGRLPFWSSSIL